MLCFQTYRFLYMFPCLIWTWIHVVNVLPEILCWLMFSSHAFWRKVILKSHHRVLMFSFLVQLGVPYEEISIMSWQKLRMTLERTCDGVRAFERFCRAQGAFERSVVGGFCQTRDSPGTILALPDHRSETPCSFTARKTLRFDPRRAFRRN